MTAADGESSHARDADVVEVVLTSRGSSARGRWDGLSITVLAGSTGPADETASYEDRNRRRRAELLADGSVVRDADTIRFVRDVQFGTPTEAAAIVMGRQANGWSNWKLADGRPLDSLRQSADDRAQLDFRRRWFERHATAFDLDVEWRDEQAAHQADRDQSGVEALNLLARLDADRDVDAFVEAMQQWAARGENRGFNGFSGQMLMNQLAKRSESPTALADLFADVLHVPTDQTDARRKIDRIVAHIEQLRVGAHPAPGHTPFMLSYFWALQDHETWPVAWASAIGFAEFLLGRALPSEPADRYLAFAEVMSQMSDSNERFEWVGAWWNATRPTLLDAVLADRCRFGADAGAVEPDAVAANADALVAVGRHLATQLVDRVSESAGRGLEAVKPGRTWKPDRPRSDTWADWRVHGETLGFRLWVTEAGALVGLHPGQVRKGWYEEAAEVIEEHSVDGFEIIGARGSKFGDGEQLQGGPSGGFIYAKRFAAEVLSEIDVEFEVTDVAIKLAPLLDELVQRATGAEPADANDPLAPFVAEFREIYPTPNDEDHSAERERFASLLAADAIALADPDELRRIWTTGRYGNPGPQSHLNISLRDADAAGYERILGTLDYLLWGEGDDSDRIDEVLDDEGDRYVRGLGESVIMKMLAICHPDRYLPIFPYAGPKGKLAMLRLLELAEPEADSRGRLQVAANDLIRDRLGHFFPGDLWGAAHFLYRYAERANSANEDGESTDDGDPVESLAEELLVDREFLDDIVALLEDKRQVILYGPPGTGKTYLAQKLAEALVPDSTRRTLVQFHPSTSYEDFFEGYRPETSADGQLSYRLTHGPLALLAARAADAPGERHLMIIDEINRANLPRVLGELLFLLEYRDKQVPTLYRPDDPFELPSDLWFIGTMNTADRSIALIDAALRRRFHFVPFFPNHGPMEGLLARWLADRGEPGWVGELVAHVNDRLADALGGPHLQIGPSYFMKRGLDEVRMRRIWEYNIEPLLEDQFFGNPEQFNRFRFEQVLADYLATAGLTSLAEFDAHSDVEATTPETDG